MHVIGSGRNFYGVYMTLRTVKIKDTTSRFSFIVSKKVAARATDRNKIKRRGYSAVETVYGDILPHTAALFFVKKDAIRASFADIQKDIVELLTKSKILLK